MWQSEQGVEIFIDVIFMLDIFLSFITSYEDQANQDVSRIIPLRYMWNDKNQSRCWVDFDIKIGGRRYGNSQMVVSPLALFCGIKLICRRSHHPTFTSGANHMSCSALYCFIKKTQNSVVGDGLRWSATSLRFACSPIDPKVVIADDSSDDPADNDLADDDPAGLS